MRDAPALTLVIPTYNEASRLHQGLDRLMRAADEGAVDLDATEVLLVDDGSTDETRSTAERLISKFPIASVVVQPRNLGKGAAVRAGVLASSGSLVAFCDADMAIDPSHLLSLRHALSRVPIAVGSRAVAGHIDYGTRVRTDAGRAFNLAVRTVGGVHLADTQCGFKGFRRGAALLLAHLQTTSGYAFDVELLWLAQRLGLEVEVVPVTWLDVPGSTVRVVHDSVRMLTDLFASRRRSRWVAAATLGGTPDGPAPAGSVVVRHESGSLLIGSVSDLGAIHRCVGNEANVQLLGLEDLVKLTPFEVAPAS